MELNRNAHSPPAASRPSISPTHIAIQEAPDGKVVDWMEKVTDAQYNGARDEQ